MELNTMPLRVALEGQREQTNYRIEGPEYFDRITGCSGLGTSKSEDIVELCGIEGGGENVLTG
jgi:hypothetical protein